MRWLAATVAAALTTLVLVWLGANSTAAGMVFLVLVVWWATQSGIVLSIYIAALCALCFDYFFLAADSHAVAGWRAGVGCDVLIRGKLPGGQPACRAGATPNRAQPSNARQMWDGSTR